MLLISHRGNLEGAKPQLENSPDYIDAALHKGFDVEIDIWVNGTNILLGHDEGTYPIALEWIISRRKSLWIHCKNVAAISFFSELQKSNHELNFFWHETDTVTLTSLGYMWVYPGKQPIQGSIAVMPEIENDSIDVCIGICTDYVLQYQTHGFK